MRILVSFGKGLYHEVMRVKNIVDTIFFTPKVCVEAAQTFVYPIGENAFAYFSSGAALAGGMVGKSEREEWHAQCVYPESDFKKIKTFDLV